MRAPSHAKLHVQFDGGLVQAREQRLALLHRIAGRQLTPRACRLDVCNGRDVAQAQALVKKWQAYLTANYYNCTGEILACLGQMYVGDERFVQHIDRYGTGTAAFMAAAIAAYTG